ncbi:class I SAM-dependent methyltransferase [Thalassotalea sp. LPB0316]|uniref:class I SAM-dependent methyltransferase n=1 Tax=Thalassotalea sp. LPB0316 TaxID=2769490 RepID=UPI00186937C6|nr:class I SAM-dependent methyltransferase [Thalassotalea sp. LPB0316]QOL26040.1 class I SAM-dependent methyltransferase [Thalassotalea sp. LPB0316]
MSVANTSQLLLKNLSLLKATKPLFINLPADAFIDEYKREYPHAQLSFFNSHYGEYLAHQAKQHPCQFSHYYQANEIHDLIIIAFPKSKAELGYTLAMLNEVTDQNTIIYFVGEKNSGVKSVEKLAKNYLHGCQKDDAARHCLLFSGCYKAQAKPFDVDEWFVQYPLDIKGKTIQIYALPGVFSQERLDVGTKLLLEYLPDYTGKKVLDFGCGAGVIGAYIASSYPSSTLALADVSALALASAKQTFAANQLKGKFIATDSMSNITDLFDAVISNPPFHQGLKTHYQATERFLSEIAKHIKVKGSLTIVANSFLKYQPIIASKFISVEQAVKANGFTVYHAIR